MTGVPKLTFGRAAFEELLVIAKMPRQQKLWKDLKIGDLVLIICSRPFECFVVKENERHGLAGKGRGALTLR